MVIHTDHRLPEELFIYEIFRRLPVESLLACSCVCKRWNSIISNPLFASFHFNQSPFSTHKSLLINTKDRFLSIDLENHENYRVTEVPETDSSSSSSIVASCNGLICLDDEPNNSLYIWNPSTLKKIQIPYYQPVTKTEVIWGFGHVSSTDEYKLIRIVDHGNLKKKVQVFSFNTNAWKNIEIGEIPPLFGTGVSFNNVIYWAVYYTEYDVGLYDHCFHVLGFDLISENFTLLEPLPEWPGHGFENPPAVFQKDGCLCVCWKNGGGIDIGMFREEEGGNSWEKVFHFDEDGFRFERRIWAHKIQSITAAGSYVVYLDGDRISFLDLNQDPPKEVSSLQIPKSKNVISYVKTLIFL